MFIKNLLDYEQSLSYRTKPQSIEKYCEAILSKADPVQYSEKVLASKEYGHNLVKLWEAIKQYTKQFTFEQAYENLIKEINECTTDTRYLNYSALFNQGLIETFTVLGCEFRYELIGKEKFMESFFGIKAGLFLPKAFLNFYNFESLFKKLMHMSIEHRISFSSLGIPDTYEWAGVKLSKATAKFCQCGKHKEIEAECPMCRKINWQNGSRSEHYTKILGEYFRT